MKSKYIFLVLLILLFVTVGITSTDKKKTVENTSSYFPINNGKTLVYESSFGESVTTYFPDDEFTISLSEGDGFKYRQTLLIKDDGVYVKETYLYFKIFLFITKEETYTYRLPLLRFPLPLLPGKTWKGEGEEYSDSDSNKVKITGIAEKEIVITKAGRFEAIKLESIVESSFKAKNRVTEWYVDGLGLIKAKIIIEGGGVMGFLRDLMGYGTIEFELKEIRKTTDN